MTVPGWTQRLAPGRWKRRAGLLGALVAGWLAGGVLIAGPAAAHAELVGTTPADGERLAAAPAEVVLTFTEPVTLPDGGLGVLDAAGRRVDDGAAGHPRGRSEQARIGLRPGLPAGAYVVTWRVVSADSHPVRGAFGFAVGDAAPLSAQEQAALARGGDGGPAADTLLAAARWAGFAGLALAVGGMVVLTVCGPAGSTRPGPARLVTAGALAAAVASMAELLLHGPYGAGRPVVDLFDPRLIEQTLQSRFGWVLLLRVLLMSGLAAVATVVLAGPARLPAAALAAGGLPVTWALAGHASTGIQVPLAVAADTLHLAAMAVWVGGLVFLAGFVLRHDPAGPAERDGPVDAERLLAVPRFSRLAFAAVVTLAATGTYQSWRQVGALDALGGTAFGRILLVKIALFGGLVALGNRSRQLVREHYQPRRLVSVAAAGHSGPPVPAPAAAGGPEVRRLRRSVGLEVLLAAAVLALTAVLVATQPGRASDSGAHDGAYDVTHALPDGHSVRITLAPARVGANQLRAEVQVPGGGAHDVPEVTASLRLPARDLGPLPVKLQRVAPGAFAARDASVPFAGDWQLRVVVRVSDFDAYTVTDDVPVR